MSSETNPSSSSSSSSASTSVPPPSTSVSASASASPSASPTTKRCRDPEDEVYIDNLHSHKRYLSEIMASSLNGLTVEDPLPENLMYSPARFESTSNSRDEMNIQYSPMSEDSDDCRYFESPTHNNSPSQPSSPVSPYRYQKYPTVFSSSSYSSSLPFHGCTAPASTSSQSRQRGSDSEGRFPSSPSDICHSADLRRAALLRSVHMRTHPPSSSAYELSFNGGQEPTHNMEDEREYQIEEVCKSLSILGPENREEACRALNLKLKGGDSLD